MQEDALRIVALLGAFFIFSAHSFYVGVLGLPFSFISFSFSVSGSFGSFGRSVLQRVAQPNIVFSAESRKPARLSVTHESCASGLVCVAVRAILPLAFVRRPIIDA